MYVRPRPRFRPRNAGGVPFSPALLFTSGVAGAWYDPSDYSTLFQDSADTNPVTAVEQPVGLMLDKSQGLALGSELITPVANQDFSSDTGYWTKSATTTIASGKASLASVPDGTYALIRTGVLTVGKVYTITIDVLDYSTGEVVIRDGAVNHPFKSPSSAASNGTKSVTFLASGNAVGIRTVGITTLSVDNISVKELAGNHASQATAASRPVLRARYNSLLYSETFSNAAWQSASSGTAAAGVKTPNFGTAPDGTQTACRIQLDVSAGSTGNQSQIYQNYACVVGNLTYQCYVKTNDGSTKTIQPFTATGAALTVTGTWQLFTFTRNSAATTDNFQFILIKGTTSDTADLLVWHPQSNPGSSAGTYQRIAAATDYATAGFLPYLSLDGTDDSFGTNSIDFTATDKMYLCAGVTKLSDAVVGIIAELSTAAGSGANLGTFNFSNQTLPVGWRFSAGSGTVGSAYAIDDFSTFTAPITNVISGIANLAGATINDEISARVNGAVPTQSISGSVSTGNFGNWPLYIGRRANASSPFEGRIYGLIVCGKMLSASELSSTESWMNSRTGAY